MKHNKDPAKQLVQDCLKAYEAISSSSAKMLLVAIVQTCYPRCSVDAVLQHMGVTDMSLPNMFSAAFGAPARPTLNSAPARPGITLCWRSDIGEVHQVSSHAARHKIEPNAILFLSLPRSSADLYGSSDIQPSILSLKTGQNSPIAKPG
jgi:hypothetical protein